MVEPTALLGQWQLTRSVRDERVGRTGTVDGQLTLRCEDNQIAWQERGTLLWNGLRLPVSRSYWLRRVDDRWWLYFPDGQPFHLWNPGHWVRHPCSADDYHGLITVNGPDSWDTLWQIVGPATRQRISTHLSRALPGP